MQLFMASSLRLGFSQANSYQYLALSSSSRASSFSRVVILELFSSAEWKPPDTIFAALLMHSYCHIDWTYARGFGKGTVICGICPNCLTNGRIVSAYRHESPKCTAALG